MVFTKNEVLQFQAGEQKKPGLAEKLKGFKKNFYLKKNFCDFAQEVPRVFGFGNALGAAILRLLTPWAVSGELGGMSITENVKSKYFNGLLRICVHWRR